MIYLNVTVNHSGSVLQQQEWAHTSQHYRELVCSSSAADGSKSELYLFKSVFVFMRIVILCTV